MPTRVTIALVAGLLAGTAAGDDNPTLSDRTDRISYAIGHQIGSDFKKQSVSLDAAALEQGLHDGGKDIEPLLDRVDMQRRLVELKRDITNDMTAQSMERMQSRQALIKQKREQGESFLRDNAKAIGIETTASGLQYRVITPGSGPRPGATDQVRINYRARRLDGQEFNSSYRKGGPTTFQVNRLVPGFTEALKLMRPGARWELYLKPELAYGRKGPLAHETIIIDVDLLEVIAGEATADAAVDATDKTPRDGAK